MSYSSSSTIGSKTLRKDVRTIDSSFAFSSLGRTWTPGLSSLAASPILKMNGQAYHHIGALLPKLMEMEDSTTPPSP